MLKQKWKTKKCSFNTYHLFFSTTKNFIYMIAHELKRFLLFNQVLIKKFIMLRHWNKQNHKNQTIYRNSHMKRWLLWHHLFSRTRGITFSSTNMNFSFCFKGFIICFIIFSIVCTINIFVFIFKIIVIVIKFILIIIIFVFLNSTILR